MMREKEFNVFKNNRYFFTVGIPYKVTLFGGDLKARLKKLYEDYPENKGYKLVEITKK